MHSQSDHTTLEEQTSSLLQSSSLAPYSSRAWLVSVFLIASSVVLSNTARAADRTWDTSIAGCTLQYFDVANCWQGALLPDEFDRAIFDSSATYTIRWDGFVLGNWQGATGSTATEVTSGNVLIQNGDVTFRDDGAVPRTYSIDLDLDVNTNATLNIGAVGTGGNPDNPMIFEVGSRAEADGGGTINVRGVGSQLDSQLALIVGESSNGFLNVSDGATVTSVQSYLGLSNNSASGAATVDGAGSSWNNSSDFWVGSFGTGTVDVTNGGTVTSGGISYLGAFNNSSGTVTIDGIGSSWTDTGDAGIQVGASGTGNLSVSNGGSLSTGGISYIGKNAGSTGVVNIDGAGSTWIQDGDQILDDCPVCDELPELGLPRRIGTLFVGQHGNGSLNISNGGQVLVGPFDAPNSNEVLIVGGESSSVGAVTIDGSGSTLTASGTVILGRRTGTGALTIQNGGTLEAGHYLNNPNNPLLNLQLLIGDSLGNGHVIVDGAGSSLNDALITLNHDGQGFGLLDVTNGGSVNSSVIIGGFGSIASPVGTAVANVDGSGSIIAGEVEVARIGTGELNVSNGGAVSGRLYIAGFGVEGATGQVSVDGIDSTLNVSALEIGIGGPQRSGTLDISNGASVTSSGGGATLSAAIGISDGEGTINVNGAGATWEHSGNVQIGTIGGTGTVNINGGSVTNTGGIFSVGSGGTINIDGGSLTTDTLENEGTLNIASNAAISGNVINTAGGNFVISGGSTVTFLNDVDHNGTGIDVASGNTIIFAGAFSGAGDITGTGTAQFEGGLAPGNSPGLLSIAGSSIFGASNVSTMELAGLIRGTEYDAIDVGGTATLDGTLEILLIDGFAVSFGDSFDLLTAASISGDFASLILPELEGTLDWATTIVSGNGFETFRAQVVPIPGAVWLFASALGLMGWRRRL